MTNDTKTETIRIANTECLTSSFVLGVPPRHLFYFFVNPINVIADLRKRKRESERVGERGVRGVRESEKGERDMVGHLFYFCGTITTSLLRKEMTR